MPQLQHSAFVHQTNGIIYICDGTAEASFDNADAFLKLEPDYALPDGIVALNVEQRGDMTLSIGQRSDGSMARVAEPSPFLAYIAKAATYAAALEEQASPLYGVTTVAKAREIVLALVKDKAHALLAPTDWYVIRAAETGETTPDDVLAEREAIRVASNAHEEAIASATLKALKSYDINTGW